MGHCHVCKVPMVPWLCIHLSLRSSRGPRFANSRKPWWFRSIGWWHTIAIHIILDCGQVQMWIKKCGRPYSWGCSLFNAIGGCVTFSYYFKRINICSIPTPIPPLSFTTTQSLAQLQWVAQHKVVGNKVGFVSTPLLPRVSNIDKTKKAPLLTVVENGAVTNPTILDTFSCEDDNIMSIILIQYDSSMNINIFFLIPIYLHDYKCFHVILSLMSILLIF